MIRASYHLGKKRIPADDCQSVTRASEAGEIELHCFGRNNYPGEPLKPTEVPGISSFGFWRTIGEQHYGLPTHQNEGIKFAMALQGEMPICIEGKNAILRPNQLMIARPWQIHSFGNPNFGKGRLGWFMFDVGVRYPHQSWFWPEWILLTKEELKVLSHSLRHNEDAIRPVKPEFTEAFLDVVQLAQTPDMVHRSTQIAVAVNRLFLKLLCALESEQVVFDDTLTDSSRTIRMFLAELPSRLKEPWSVRTMADSCKIGTTHFTNQFMTITGETPARYLQRVRLERAYELLRKTPLPTKEIGTQIGIPRPSYFIEVFSRRYGQTPTQYRKTAQSTDSVSNLRPR